MQFAIVNSSNNFDPVNNDRFATFEDAEERVKSILAVYPTQTMSVVSIIKTYRAEVTITAEDVPEQDQPAE
jgi:hypothetical protein